MATPHWDHQHPALPSLLYQLPRQGGQCTGDDHSVIGGAWGIPICTISHVHDGPVADFCEPLLGLFSQYGVYFDSDHVLVAKPVAEQCGVVSGSCAHFQYPHTVGHIEGFQHDRHEPGAELEEVGCPWMGSPSLGVGKVPLIWVVHPSSW